MRYIQKSTWPRAELFDFFSAVSFPFYSVAFRVDVTALHAYTRARGLSFYYAMGYLVTQAANGIENFRYFLRDGKIGLWDERIPSFTDLHPGSDLFHIVTLPCRGTLEEFCRAAWERSRSQQTFLDQEQETEDLLYLSCLPWVDLTSCTNERNLDPDDAIPRIAWGRIVGSGGRETLGMSVEVNHRFVDGVHIGRFYEALQVRIDALEP